jgi:pyruvyl transferase EpsI
LTSAPRCSKKNGVLLCFRQDKEKKVDAETEPVIREYLVRNNIPYKETTTVIKKHVTQMNRQRELHKKWREFSCARMVITDRLHAMIFAVITHTSCIALDNESKKVSGSYEWIKSLSYICIVESVEDILLKIPEMLNKPTDESHDYPDISFKQLIS